jgi:hypothetical protein
MVIVRVAAMSSPCSECCYYQDLLRDNEQLRVALIKIRDEAELCGELGRDDIIKIMEGINPHVATD